MRIVATVSLLLALVVADTADAAPKSRLKSFDSCKDLVGYARDGALRTRGGVGVPTQAVPLPANRQESENTISQCRIYA